MDHLVQLNLIDTCVFKHAKPKFLISNLENGIMKFILSEDKLNLQEIMKNFIQIKRSRKKGDFRVRKNASPVCIRSGKETALIRYFQNKDNFVYKLQPKDEAGAIRIFNESEFMELL